MADGTTSVPTPGTPRDQALRSRSVSTGGLHVVVCDLPGCTVFTLTGELDVATAPLLNGCFDALADHASKQIVVDVSGLAFCDCAGVNSLVRGLRLAVAAGGWVRLCGAAPTLRKILRITRVAPVLPCYSTAMEALAFVAYVPNQYSTVDGAL